MPRGEERGPRQGSGGCSFREENRSGNASGRIKKILIQEEEEGVGGENMSAFGGQRRIVENEGRELQSRPDSSSVSAEGRETAAVPA